MQGRGAPTCEVLHHRLFQNHPSIRPQVKIMALSSTDVQALVSITNWLSVCCLQRVHVRARGSCTGSEVTTNRRCTAPCMLCLILKTRKISLPHQSTAWKIDNLQQLRRSWRQRTWGAETKTQMMEHIHVAFAAVLGSSTASGSAELTNSGMPSPRKTAYSRDQFGIRP